MSNIIKIAIIGLGQVGNYLYRELDLQRRNIEIKTAKKIKKRSVFIRRLFNSVKTNEKNGWY